MSRQPSPARKVVLFLAAVPVALLLCCGGGVLAAALDRDPSVTASLHSPTTTPPATPAAAGKDDSAGDNDSDNGSPGNRETDGTGAGDQALPDKVPMPDLRHENAAIVADELADLGFTDIRFGSPAGAWVVLPQNWTVTRQSAAPGKLIALTTTVVLTCTPLA